LGRYQFAASLWSGKGGQNRIIRKEPTMLRSGDNDSTHAETNLSIADRVEYVVRPSDDSWLIEHDGDRYGPYKDRREAMFFAIDAAHKLGALGKNTHVRMTDQAGHPLTTWTYGTDRYPAIF
jgi:hypothetical protein